MDYLFVNNSLSMNIRVNCILPGIFPSQLTTTDSSSDASALNDFAAKAAKRNTAGRAGRPEEIMGPCLLLSSKAGGYMNGGFLMVEGGRFMVSVRCRIFKVYTVILTPHRAALSTMASACRTIRMSTRSRW